MSDKNPTQPDDASATPERKTKQRRSWPQRIMLTLLILALVAGVFRVGLSLLLPTVIRKVANAYGLDCTYDRIQLSLLGGNADIWNMVIRSKEGGDSIAKAEYVHGIIEPFHLLRGQLVVWRAEADGVDILIDREADGSIPILKQLVSRAKAQKAAPAATTDGPPQQISLKSPLRLDAVRLTHMMTTFRDRSMTPVFETTIETSLRISNVGSARNPAEFELEVGVDPLLDTFNIQGEAHDTATSLEVDAHALMRGLHPKAVAEYLAPLGLKPVANNMEVRANLKLRADVIANTPDVRASLTLDGIRAIADGAEWASLEKISLDAKKLNVANIELGRLVIVNGRATAARSADGRLRIAGLELVAAATAATQPVAAPVAAASISTGARGLRLSLDEISLKNLEASFTDEMLSPACKLLAQVDDLSIKDIAIDPARPDAKATLAGSISIPGVINAIELSGSATPSATTKQFSLHVNGRGVRPDALRPYFDLLGIESQLKDGSFDANLDGAISIDAQGQITADARANGLRFDDGTPLFAFDSATVSKLRWNPIDGGLRVESIMLSGPAVNTHRDRDGRFAVAGFRAGAASKPASTSMPATPTDANSIVSFVRMPPIPHLPPIEIDRLSWKDIRLTFDDETKTPRTSIALGDAGLELNNVLIDLGSTASKHAPGAFRAWLSAPNVVNRLAIDGTVATQPRGIVLDSRVVGQGITGASLAPYFKSAGIVPVMKAGSLTLSSALSLSETDDGVAATLDVKDLRYNDGSTELAGVDALHLGGLELSSAGLSAEQFTIERPRAHIVRNADGTIEAGGIRLVAKDSNQKPVAAPGPARPATLHLPALPITIVLGKLQLDAGELEWTDNLPKTPVHTRLTATASLSNARIAPNAAPATFNVVAQVDGAVDHATITGTLGLAPDAPAAHLMVVADGIRAGPFTGYLPSNIACSLHDGQFTGSIDVGLSNNTGGGIAGHFAASEIAFSDGADRRTAARVESFKFIASRIDPAGGVIALDEVSSSGVQADLQQLPNGGIDALGLRITPPPPAAAPAAPESTELPVSTAANAPPPEDVKTLVADARRPFPLLTLEKLDLGIKRFGIAGLTGSDAAPITLANVRLRNVEPMSLAGPDAENRPPIKLAVDGAVDPLISKFAIALQAKPFAVEPSLSADVDASGITGKKLTDVVPAIRPYVDGSKLADGTFHLHADFSIDYGRHGPRDLDLGRGFTAVFDVKPVEFREMPGGPVIAGLDDIRTEGIKVEPKTGNVEIKSIDITKPIGRIVRQTDGIHAFGIVIPIPSSGGAAPDAPSTEMAPTSDSESPVAADAASPTHARPSNEIRLDRFTITGVDVILEDQTTIPATLIPLKSLDVEVRDLSNQMPWTGKPARFSVLCTSDKVPLPPRKGATGTASTQPSADGEKTEMRELFSEITASGKVGIQQVNNQMVLDGWAKTSVNGFELLGVRGIARQYGVTIGGGAFDDSNDIRFRPDGPIETKNQLVFTNLSLSESDNGPLQKAFKLPAPIDVAIGAVTDPDGSITMNLPVPIKNGKIHSQDVIGPAVGAVAGVLLTGIASAPVKAVGGVGQLFGLGGSDKVKPEPPIMIAFLPGYSALSDQELGMLAVLAVQLRKDDHLELQLRHSLTSGDVERLSIRANPSAEDCMILAERLRRQKADLLSRRAVLAAQARGDIGSQSATQAARSLEMLRNVDRQIESADDALDQLYDRLRPGADTQTDRRTRAACVDIGRQRLAMVRSAILQANVKDADQRIHLANAQFDPSESSDGGEVIITLIRKKH